MFSSKTGTLPLPVHSHQNKPVSESGATWDSSGLEEVAGYCVPPVQDKKFKVIDNNYMEEYVCDYLMFYRIETVNQVVLRYVEHSLSNSLIRIL